MPTRVPSLLDPPIGFADGGAGAHEQPQTLQAFALALKLGATGLACNAWVTADGEVVLHDSGTVRIGLRRRPIADVARGALPDGVASLAEVYDSCGTEAHLAVEVATPEDGHRVLGVAKEAGGAALGRLWLGAADAERVVACREAAEGVRVVETVRFRQLEKVGPERRAAQMADAGIDAVRMPFDDWTSGRTTLFHRFGRVALGSAATHRRQLDDLLTMGIDGVFSDHVDRMVDALARVT